MEEKKTEQINCLASLLEKKFNMEANAESSVPRLWRHAGGENLNAVFKSATWVIRFTNGFWTIWEKADMRFYAWSSGLTPLTVRRGEWAAVDGSSTLLHFKNLRLGSSDKPVPLGHLGEDFFLHSISKKPVWFTVDKNDTTTFHSGSKRMKGTTGVRFCSICRKMSSANNFVSQHLPIHARTQKNATSLEDVRAALWLADAVEKRDQKKKASVRKRR